MIPFLLVVMSVAGSPQFVLPMSDLAVCSANQALLLNMMGKDKAIVGCWDMSRQAFVFPQGAAAGIPRRHQEDKEEESF